jgi:transposase-like protein
MTNQGNVDLAAAALHDKKDTVEKHYKKLLSAIAGGKSPSRKYWSRCTEALWGTWVSSGTVSRLNQKIYRHIEAWRNREIFGDFPYVYLDGVILKRIWAGEVRNVPVLVAIGVGSDGFRQILGVAEGEKEDLEGSRGFLCHLKDRVAGVNYFFRRQVQLSPVRSRFKGRAVDHFGRVPRP